MESESLANDCYFEGTCPLTAISEDFHCDKTVQEIDTGALQGITTTSQTHCGTVEEAIEAGKTGCGDCVAFHYKEADDLNGWMIDECAEAPQGGSQELVFYFGDITTNELLSNA